MRRRNDTATDDERAGPQPPYAGDPTAPAPTGSGADPAYHSEPPAEVDPGTDGAPSGATRVDREDLPAYSDRADAAEADRTEAAPSELTSDDRYGGERPGEEAPEEGLAEAETERPEDAAGTWAGTGASTGTMPPTAAAAAAMPLAPTAAVEPVVPGPMPPAGPGTGAAAAEAADTTRPETDERRAATASAEPGTGTTGAGQDTAEGREAAAGAAGLAGPEATGPEAETAEDREAAVAPAGADVTGPGVQAPTGAWAGPSAAHGAEQGAGTPTAAPLGADTTTGTMVPPAAMPTGTAAAAAEQRLVGPDEGDSLRQRWRELQGGFVDDPGDSVRQASVLVGEVVELVSRRLTEQWQGIQPEGDAATEGLRQQLRRYRGLFDRLLGL